MTATILEGQGLTRTYWLGETPVKALGGVDVTIRRGEFLVLQGPSGSGKTTLINLLGLLDRPDGGSLALDGISDESNAPRHQVVLRSAYDFARHASFDAQVRYVDDVRAVPAYVTADLRLAYRPIADLELSLVGQNLLDARHPEQASQLGVPTIEVPRGVYGKIAWRF